MITGDHPATALTIARSVGIESSGVMTGVELDSADDDTLRSRLHTVSVFARVQPAHKARILIALESMGGIICMGGDGVNDAPALKRAHVGVGMGLNGTAVAREASAMVLTDDDFSTIVSAIEEGRRIYDNIRKFVLFLMRSNAGEVMIIAGAILLQMPLPLLPLHILWINLVTDSFPALALAAEPGEAGIMKRQPRKRDQGIFYGEWFSLGLSAVLNAVLALSVFKLSLFHFPDDIAMARTAALTTTIVYQMALAFSTRTRSSAFTVSPFQNRWLLFAVFVSIVLHILLLMTPLSVIFSVKAIPILLWAEIIVGATLSFVIFEMYKVLPQRWRK
jgi:Ca2+-transporting ATPase